MKIFARHQMPRIGVWFLLAFGLLAAVPTLHPQTSAAPSAGTNSSVLLTMEGKVEVSRAGSSDWTSGQTNQSLRVNDRLRTGVRSRATVRLSNLTVLRVNELTTLQIQPPSRAENQPVLDLKSGAAYLFSRENCAMTKKRPTMTNANCGQGSYTRFVGVGIPRSIWEH